MLRIGDKIRERRLKLGWSITKLATVAGLSQGFVSRLETDQSGYSEETLHKIAGALGLSAERLFASISNVETAQPDFRSIPVLDYVQAGLWREVDDRTRDAWASETIPINLDCPPSVFGLRVAGESMLPQFKPGDIVIIDPTRQPRPGSFVVAQDESGAATFKQYRDLGQNEAGVQVFELMPLNDLVASVRSDRKQIAIVGVMIEHRQYYR